MSDKELDKIFKSKLTNREFAFNPANWEAMEAMLDADKKAGTFYWWSSAAIVVFGAFIASLVQFQTPQLPSEEFPFTNIEAQIEESESLVNEAQELPSLKSKEVESIEADPIISEDTESVSNVLNGTSSTEKEAGKVASAYSIQKDDIASVKLDKTASEEVSSGMPEELITDEIGNFNIDLTQGLALKSLPSFGYSFDSPSELITNRVRGNYIRAFQKQHEVWLQAGPDFSRSTNDNSLSTGWMLGLNYQYRFSYLWSVNVGLNYSARTNLGVSSSSYSVIRGFGADTVTTTVHNKRVDYFEIPVVVNYTFGGHHQIGLGGYAASLFNVNSELVKSIRDWHDGTVTEDDPITQNGLSDDFNTIDYGLMASYFYEYNPLLSFGLQYKHGLSDISKNNGGQLNHYHRNAQARFIVRYRLF